MLSNRSNKQYRLSVSLLCLRHLKAEFSFISEAVGLLPKYVAKPGENQFSLVDSGKMIIFDLLVETSRIRVSELATRYKLLWEELRKRGEEKWAGNLPNIREWKGESESYFPGPMILKSDSPIVYLIQTGKYPPQLEPLSLIDYEVREVSSCDRCRELLEKVIRVKIDPQYALFMGYEGKGER